LQTVLGIFADIVHVFNRALACPPKTIKVTEIKMSSKPYFSNELITHVCNKYARIETDSS